MAYFTSLVGALGFATGGFAMWAFLRPDLKRLKAENAIARKVHRKEVRELVSEIEQLRRCLSEGVKKASVDGSTVEFGG